MPIPDGRLFVPSPEGELLVFSVNTLRGQAGESTEEVAQGMKRRLMAQDEVRNAISTPFQRHFGAISAPFQRHFSAISTLFQRRFNAISTPFQR